MFFQPENLPDINAEMEDLKALIKELELAIPELMQTTKEKNHNKKWELSSAMINCFSEMPIGSFFDAFNDLYEEQVDLLNAFDQRCRVVIKKTRHLSGISTAFALYAYYYARINPGCKILYVSNYDYQSRTIYNLISNFARGNSYRDNNLITMHNGSNIKFIIESNVDNFSLKNEFDLIILDGAEHYNKITQVINNILFMIKPQGKLFATEWKEFSFVGWKEVVV